MAQQESQEKKDSETANALGCFVLFTLAALLCYGVCAAAYTGLDKKGLVSHQAESVITVRGNWLVGESKDCLSQTTSVDDQPSYALAALFCDDGPTHRLKVTFWGRKDQPEYATVNWKCTREQEGKFTCLELSGVR
jgi:hypothetical protein